jgi:hypothetical protein
LTVWQHRPRDTVQSLAAIQLDSEIVRLAWTLAGELVVWCRAGVIRGSVSHPGEGWAREARNAFAQLRAFAGGRDPSRPHRSPRRIAEDSTAPHGDHRDQSRHHAGSAATRHAPLPSLPSRHQRCQHVVAILSESRSGEHDNNARGPLDNAAQRRRSRRASAVAAAHSASVVVRRWYPNGSCRRADTPTR